MEEKSYQESLSREERRKFTLAAQMLREFLSPDVSQKERGGMMLMALGRELLPTLQNLAKNPKALEEAGIKPSQANIKALNRLISEIQSDLESGN